ncbi:E3 ubiquitin-protein ligase TM129 isoform X3 [Cyclopterus lumpus]|uniref:E3 ubiquitin-protein ligase TM129 isoform X3 n=1 Tax=Cyclopterus lumpus TaxID=8103 RepID=UPI001486262F|nr:E3 ubiquitin-protein ligase TM129 isoform X3 [Cyclopterus lumpus]
MHSQSHASLSPSQDGYYLGMCVAAPEKNLGYVHQVSDSWRAFLLLSLCIQLTSWTLVIYWSRHHWHNHPISRALQAHIQPPHAGWGSVASSVNTEFRRIDKFSTGAPGARVIVTDSWVLKVTTYHIHMALQSECHVTVTESRQHQLSPDQASPAQILTLRVDSINPAVRPFDIRLISTEYAELRQKLHAPIRNSPNVVIHQTMSELFLETFRAQVDLNQPYTLPSGQEPITSPSASSVSADPCGVCPVWVDGSPAAKTSKDLRPGCPAESPVLPVEPNSVYWTSVRFTDETKRIQTDCSNICFEPQHGAHGMNHVTFGEIHFEPRSKKRVDISYPDQDMLRLAQRVCFN